MPDDRLSRDLAQVLLETAPVGLVLITAPGTVDWANAAYFATTGRSSEIVGRNFHEISESDGSWSSPIRTAVDAALRNGTPASFPSIRARYRNDPHGVFLDVDVRPLPGGTGESPRALLLVRDVSDRVRLSDQAHLFYESFRGSTNPIQLTDANGIMVDVNPAYERIYGYSRAECIGRKPNLVRSRSTPTEVYDQMWTDLKDPARGYWSGELLNRDRQGVERPVFLTITAIRDANGVVSHFLGVAVDRREQRSWELRAAHTDRLTSVGQLAAGVAHEINTPLANVMLVAESLRRRSRDPEVQARLDTLTEQVDVAARIVRGLLDFARRDEPVIGEVDLEEVARSSVEFLRGKQSPDVEIREQYDPAGVPVSGDRGQLIQVVTNLLNNAYDAQAGSGQIRVVVRRERERAVLEVTDHGPGIPEPVRPHIFEPFFTTKSEGQGTGLGLAICLGIVQAHHGSILARNVDGEGAQFVVSLPLRRTPPRSDRDPASS